MLIVKLASATGAFQTTAALVYDGPAVITGLRSAQMGVLGLGQYYTNQTNTPYFLDSNGTAFGAQPAAGEPCPPLRRPPWLHAAMPRGLLRAGCAPVSREQRARALQLLSRPGMRLLS